MRRLVENLNTMDLNGKCVIEVNDNTWDIEWSGSHWVVRTDEGLYDVNALLALGCKVYELVPREWAEFDWDSVRCRVNRRLEVEMLGMDGWGACPYLATTLDACALAAARELLREDA